MLKHNDPIAFQGVPGRVMKTMHTGKIGVVLFGGGHPFVKVVWPEELTRTQGYVPQLPYWAKERRGR